MNKKNKEKRKEKILDNYASKIFSQVEGMTYLKNIQRLQFG